MMERNDRRVNSRTGRRESRAMRMIRERRRRRKLARYSIAAAALLCILILSGSIMTYASPAKAPQQTYKYYTSICIEKGQTLEDIAEEYISEEYRSNEQYISEVKHMNHLSSDEIHPGCYLIVPYYSSEILK